MRRSVLAVLGAAFIGLAVVACGPQKPSSGGLEGAAVPQPTPTEAVMQGSSDNGGAMGGGGGTAMPTQAGAAQDEPTPTPTP